VSGRGTLLEPGWAGDCRLHRVYSYLLRDLVIDRPNQVWCVDLTYIPMRRGFLYLVAVMDWPTRKVSSWRLSNTMDAEFCTEALDDALKRFGPPEIFNTDSKNDGVGTFSAVGRIERRIARGLPTQRGGPVALTRTPIDRASCLSLDLSGGWAINL
jgi:transposase InsO family protein